MNNTPLSGLRRASLKQLIPDFADLAGVDLASKVKLQEDVEQKFVRKLWCNVPHSLGCNRLGATGLPIIVHDMSLQSRKHDSSQMK